MNGPLRILHLEDEPDYCDLVQSLLAQAGYEAESVRAADRPGFEAALAPDKFDVILADYSLPAYNGLEALRVARERCPGTPFLLVSGTIGEQAAIESLKAGATDYVLKHWPERLVPAIHRAVEEARERAHRRRIETELVRREKYFRAITENALDIITLLNRDGLFIYNSPSVKRVLGYEPRELAGQNAFGLVHPEDLPQVLREFELVLGDPQRLVTLEFRFRHKDGSWRTLEAVGQNCLGDPAIGGVVVNSRNVSKRKRVEHRNAALSKLGLSLSSATSPVAAAGIIRAVADELFHWDVFTLDLYCAEEDRIYPLLNVDTDRNNQRLELPVSGPVRAPSGMARRIITRGAELNLREEPVTMPADVVPIGDTTRPSASLMLVPIRSRTKVIGILSIQSYQTSAYDQADLSTLQTLADHCGGALERIRAEQAWRDSEQRFRDLFEGSPDAIFVEDTNGTVLDLNPAACRLHAAAREDLIGKNVLELIPADQREQAARDFRALVEGRLHQVEGASRTRDGRAVPVEVRASRIQYAGQEVVLLHVRDLTDRKRAEAALRSSETSQKRLEEQLRQSQKMEAIGQLAGGVAHDFNNILTVIHGHAALLTAGSGLTGVSSRSAQQISQAAERAAGLTRQLLTFSRRQVMQPRRLDLNEVVGNMTKMLRRILGEDITLQLNYSPRPALTQADAGMMEQVLLNLAVNARDAMPKGGVLGIRISVLEVDARRVAEQPEARVGRFVCVTITDTGCGIASENLRRIFEPFFTTKEVGKGTGLGLATVYGIVEQHQGWVEVESEVGKGTTFRVFLPRSEAAAGAAEAPPDEPAVRGGKETILVVEDEVPVRELVCRVLSGHGYRILQAESGVRALEVWQSSKEQIDLVLTDLVMPDRMNGRELAEALWAERPRLKVIFTSGYSAEVVGKDFVLRRDLNYLQKPYHPRKLALAVRDCLDAVN